MKRKLAAEFHVKELVKDVKCVPLHYPIPMLYPLSSFGNCQVPAHREALCCGAEEVRVYL